MLNLYQLWLDDLYPRAKFADGLAMIEKLGHSKRIQVMRKAWIDEGKPRDKYDIDFRQPEASKLTTTEQNGTGPEQVLTKPTNSAEDETSKTTKPKEASGDAEERDLFLSDDEAPPNARDPFDDDLDDLDALLAEEADRPRTRPTSAQPQETPDDFADDLEAMEGMEGLW